MQDASIQISLNTITDIETRLIRNFSIQCSMLEGLPYGSFIIADSSAEVFAKYENLQIGAKVDIKIISNQSTPDNEDSVTFPTYYILCVENSCETDPSTIAGNIKVWFGHPWFLFKDIKNHAYKPLNSSELIKEILKNEDRGMSFNIEKDNFDVTDDSGKSRYKVCETDWDFIKNKILPYVAIDRLPAHFYCNEKNIFYLKSFKNLYKENPKAIFSPNEKAMGDNDNIKKIVDLCDKYNIDKNKARFPINSANINVGNINLLKEIYPSFYFELLVNNTSATGKKRPTNLLKKGTGTSFANVLPLDRLYVLNNAGTSVKVIHNRELIDSMMFLFGSAKIVDEMFTVEITSNFNRLSYSIGDTADIYLAPLKYSPKDKKIHWLNGKWLVNKIEHLNDEEQFTRILTKTTLIRPTFVGSDKTTSLSFRELMHSV